MAHIFYDHLINWDKVTQSLTTMGISGEERLELIEVIEESLHTELLILILDQIPVELHETYITQFFEAPHDPKHFTFIAQHSKSSIELLIHDHSEAFFDDLIADFLES